MENEKLRQIRDKVTDWVSEQPWFQQLKAKWDELDNQSRLYLKYAGAGGVAFLLLFILLSSFWRVHSLKAEYAEKMEILNLVQQAGDELRRLKDSGSRVMPGGAPGPWQAFFETVATAAGVDKSKLSLSQEKSGTSTEMAKEALYEVSLKKVNIKQAVRYAYMVENGTRPVKVKNLMIDTKADPSGYVDATLAVSAFTIGEKK